MLPKLSERNAAFNTATRMEQRVMIAQDVIEQLDAKEFLARRGEYYYPVSTDSYSKEKVACSVCAIGALAVSVLDGEVNNLRADYTYQTGQNLGTALSDYFDVYELRVIEAAFEGTPVRSEYDQDNGFHGDYLGSFLYGNATENLRNIMENIVNNGGNFVKEQMYTWRGR